MNKRYSLGEEATVKAFPVAVLRVGFLTSRSGEEPRAFVRGSVSLPDKRRTAGWCNTLP